MPVTGFNHAPFRRRVLEGRARLRRADRNTTEAIEKRPNGVGLGARGGFVLNTKKHLNAAGYQVGTLSDAFGAPTREAVKAFQKHSGLPVTAVVDGATWKKLNGNPYRIEVCKVDGVMMSKRTAIAFLKMKAAAAKDGVHLNVVSGFRTMAQQRALWERYGAPRAARPGFSNHQSGIALDIETNNGTNAASRWLLNNGNRFGFRETVSFEPWHWEYLP